MILTVNDPGADGSGGGGIAARFPSPPPGRRPALIRRSLSGIRQQTLALFAMLTFLSLLGVGTLAVLATERIAGSTGSQAGQLEELAVGETSKALGDLAQRKLEDRARLAAAKTTELLEGARADSRLIAAIAGPALDGSVSGNLSDDLSHLLSTAPKYPVLAWDGTETPERLPVYEHLFVFDAGGTLVAAAGNASFASAVGRRFATSHWFTEASGALGLAAKEEYLYDPFAHNDSAGNGYWEPGAKATDMIVLPHRDLAPFAPVLPSNLAALRGRSAAEQHGAGPLVPDRGNWDSHQVGLLVLRAIRDPGGRLVGIAGLDLSLPSATRFFRLVQAGEQADGRIGYAYAFNREGVLLAHKDQQHIGSDSSWHYWVQWMERNETGFISYTFRDVFRYVAYAEIKDLGWTVAVTSPASDFTKPAKDAGQAIETQGNATTADLAAQAGMLRTDTLWLTAGATVAALLVGLAVAQHVVGPLRHLTAIASMLGGGEREEASAAAKDLSVGKSLTGRSDEIGSLAVAVDEMVAAVREESVRQQEQQEKAARQMEEQVKFVMERAKPAVNITIQDSVVSGSTIGAPAQAKAPVFSACPYCGKAFGLPETPAFCPFCRKKLLVD